jgi:RNA polymerase sigma-70 factor (ECF subfamily)
MSTATRTPTNLESTVQPQREPESHGAVRTPAQPTGDEPIDWYAILAQVDAGNVAAFAQLARLISGYLCRWNAFDFQAEWDDVIQDVSLAAIDAYRRQRFTDRRAVVGYIRSTTRFKFVDRIRASRRVDLSDDLDQVLGPAAMDAALRPSGTELHSDLWASIAHLAERHRAAVLSVYAEGRTYEDASEATGIPLGSLKRYLRLGLAELRRTLRAEGVPA